MSQRPLLNPIACEIHIDFRMNVELRSRKKEEKKKQQDIFYT